MKNIKQSKNQIIRIITNNDKVNIELNSNDSPKNIKILSRDEIIRQLKETKERICSSFDEFSKQEDINEK